MGQQEKPGETADPALLTQQNEIGVPDQSGKDGNVPNASATSDQQGGDATTVQKAPPGSEYGTVASQDQPPTKPAAAVSQAEGNEQQGSAADPPKVDALGQPQGGAAVSSNPPENEVQQKETNPAPGTVPTSAGGDEGAPASSENEGQSGSVVPAQTEQTVKEKEGDSQPTNNSGSHPKKDGDIQENIDGDIQEEKDGNIVVKKGGDSQPQKDDTQKPTQGGNGGWCNCNPEKIDAGEVTTGAD